MKKFASLVIRLDQFKKDQDKELAIQRYFTGSQDPDKTWAIALLLNKKPKRIANTKTLREWAAQESGIPLWLIEESYHIAGDLAETLANIIPDNKARNDHSLDSWMSKIVKMNEGNHGQKHREVLNAWRCLGQKERFLFNKLISGTFRSDIPQNLLVKVLAKNTGLSEHQITLQLSASWDPETTKYKELIYNEEPASRLSKPFPFPKLHVLDKKPEKLGKPECWSIERAWDGIRFQMINRGDKVLLWSEEGEFLTDHFPELQLFRDEFPEGTILEGVVVASENGKVLPSENLDKRIWKKGARRKLTEDVPVQFIIRDLLKYKNTDIRAQSLAERQRHLRKLLDNMSSALLQASQIIGFSSWEELNKEKERSREMNSKGLLLRDKKNTFYQEQGDWWIWQPQPLSIDSVLIYATRSENADLFNLYTFAVWDGETLVPLAKTGNGLTREEIIEIDNYVKNNTLERFGPVRSVQPELVFEIAFDEVKVSKRRKSGVTVINPRINRWKKDKTTNEPHTLNDLLDLL